MCFPDGFSERSLQSRARQKLEILCIYCKWFINCKCHATDSVTLTTSLATLAIVMSHQSMEELERGRERIVLSVENVHGYVCGEDAKFPMLRKDLGYAVAELDKTYLF